MKQALLPLTSFRFFAAAVVVMCHRPHLGDDWLPYERHGPAGVPFFFLLSGFILAYTYYDRFLTRRPHATRDFLVARAARIMPAYVLAFGVAIGAIVAVYGIRGITLLKYAGIPWKILAHLTMTQAWIPDHQWCYAFNPPGWSLSCEAFFYLLFPLLFMGLATGSLLRRVAVFAAFSAPWVAVLGLYIFTPVDPVNDEMKWVWLGCALPLTRVFDFVCGVALGLLFVRLRPEIGPARGGRYWAWGVLELGALGVLWATLHFCPWSPGTNGGPPFAIRMLTWQGYYLPSFACLVWVGALGRGPLSRVMSWSPLVYLGELSYGVYIFHWPVYELTRNLQVRWGIEMHPYNAAALSCAGTLLISALSFHFWETPIRRLVRGRPSWPVAEASAGAARPLPQPERRAA